MPLDVENRIAKVIEQTAPYVKGGRLTRDQVLLAALTAVTDFHGGIRSTWIIEHALGSRRSTWALMNGDRA